MDANDPRHGSPAGAVAHQKEGETPCTPCRKAKRRAAIERELDQLAGRPRLVPLGRRAHAVICRVPRGQLAEASGLPGHVLSRMKANGPDTIVFRSTQEKILTAANGTFWTAVGIQRRLRALQAIGWSMRALGMEIGAWPDNLLDVLKRDVVFVRTEFAETIIAAYDERCMSPQSGRGASRARNSAAAREWAPPLAWEDIDDPDAVPDLGAPDVQLKGGVRPTAVVLEDAEFLADGDLNLTNVLERLGLRRDTFHAACRREGRMDLYWRLANREPDADNLRAARAGLARAKQAVA